MSDNPEYDKALNDMYGEGFTDNLKCKECGAEFKLCPHCKEAICPNDCEGV